MPQPFDQRLANALTTRGPVIRLSRDVLELLPESVNRATPPRPRPLPLVLAAVDALCIESRCNGTHQCAVFDLYDDWLVPMRESHDDDPEPPRPAAVMPLARALTVADASHTRFDAFHWLQAQRRAA
jgi:hypothetical protein